MTDQDRPGRVDRVISYFVGSHQEAVKKSREMAKRTRARGEVFDEAGRAIRTGRRGAFHGHLESHTGTGAIQVLVCRQSGTPVTRAPTGIDVRLTTRPTGEKAIETNLFLSQRGVDKDLLIIRLAPGRTTGQRPTIADYQNVGTAIRAAREQRQQGN